MLQYEIVSDSRIVPETETPKLFLVFFSHLFTNNLMEGVVK
jgi:hypothetical protein